VIRSHDCLSSADRDASGDEQLDVIRLGWRIKLVSNLLGTWITDLHSTRCLLNRHVDTRGSELEGAKLVTEKAESNERYPTQKQKLKGRSAIGLKPCKSHQCETANEDYVLAL